MKDLIISWNEDQGFYCEDFESEYFFVILASLIKKYNLKTDSRLKSTSEIEMYISTRELNLPYYNLELLEEDGSEWIYG